MQKLGGEKLGEEEKEEEIKRKKQGGLICLHSPEKKSKTPPFAFFQALESIVFCFAGL